MAARAIKTKPVMRETPLSQIFIRIGYFNQHRAKLIKAYSCSNSPLCGNQSDVIVGNTCVP